MMGLGLPDLSGVIEATKDMPQQFEQLVDRLDTLIQLVTETNEILRENNNA